MKDFDLEAAKKGAEICTRSRRKVRIVSYNMESDNYPILGLIEAENGKEIPENYTKEGRANVNNAGPHDLIMAPVRYEGWVRVNLKVKLNPNRIYPQCEANIYETEEKAREGAPEGIRFAHIEWEDDE